MTTPSSAGIEAHGPDSPASAAAIPTSGMSSTSHPQSAVPESIMPGYAFLAERELNAGDMRQDLLAPAGRRAL